MFDKIIQAYNEAIFDTDRDRALNVVHDAIAQGVTPEDIVFKVVFPAIEAMIKSISENFDANLAQHFMTSQIGAEVVEKMIPLFKKSPEATGSVVIGTSLGDFHGLGKRIVIGCLSALMIDVTDLGLNVVPERFVDEAVAHSAHVIGISSMMVHTARGENGCLKVRQILKERGLEDRIKIAVGGAPYRYDKNLYRVVKADGWAENGISAGKVILDLIKEVHQ
jgi:methylmalonyl-CoA mutase cobalamin-binding domain/chain